MGSRLIRSNTGDYSQLNKGKLNLFKLFVERAMTLVKPTGMVGLLTPSGIASDKTAAPFFKGVATGGRLKALCDFENRRTRFEQQPFFPDVDSRRTWRIRTPASSRRIRRRRRKLFLMGHISAFAFFGGVPLSILYDNLKIAVAHICGDGKRERTRAFTELVSHYLFSDRFGRPGKGNDKGKVEGLVKYARSNFMTPIPVAASFDDLNAMLTERCRARQMERAGRHAETIGARLAADLDAFRDLPAVPQEPC